MPTKPSTSPPIWASNANWTVGPHSGQPTKVAPSAGEAQNGQVGGQTYKGQWSNYLGNLFSSWITDWLALGSSIGAADAHVLETDSSGYVAVRQIDALGGTGTATGINGQGVGAAPGVAGFGGNGAATGSGDTFTGGFGLRGISGSAADLAGVLGLGLSGADHYGVLGIGAGAHPGVFGQGGSTSSNGVEGNGGSVSGIGVLGTGGSGGAGVRGDGNPGVWGESQDTTAAYGVLGRSEAASDDASAGVRGSGFGDAMGVWGVGVDGYGVVATSQNTTRSALRVDPQDSAPTTALSGDVYYSDQEVGSGPLPHDELRVRSRGGWRSVMMETLGFVRMFATNTGTVTATTTSVPVTVMSPSMAAPNEPRRTGSVYFRIGGEIRRSGGGTTQSIIVRLVDVTASANVVERTIAMFQDGTNALWERYLNLMVSYTLPDVGPRDFRLEIETTNGGAGNVGIRDASVQAYGVI